jgi:hypothetical protein
MSFGYGWKGPNIVKDGLVLYLDPDSPNSYFDKTSTTLKDISGKNYNASLIGGLTYQPTNACFQFDGTDEIIRISSGQTDLMPQTSDFTLETWLNFGAFTGTFRQIWWGHAGGGTVGFGVVLNSSNNNLIAEVYGTSGGRQQKNLGSMTSYLNSWHQFDFVIIQSTFQLLFYIDSVLISTSTFTNWGSIDGTFGGTPMQLGALNTAPAIWYYNGKIGSVKVYKNKALSAQEVLQNYNATKSRFGL